MVFNVLLKQFHARQVSHLYGIARYSVATASSKPGLNKTLLVELRKKTGYSFSKCNEALKLSNNNVADAEAWLHDQAEKEGWSKANKLKGRSTNQGLVGVVAEGNFAAIVEVACETDFVARNELFQELVAKTTESTLKFRKTVISQNQSVNSINDGHITHLREVLITYHLENLKVVDTNTTLAEHIVETVGKIGENIKLRRALAIATNEENVIGTSVHGNTTGKVNDCLMGTFAAIVVLKPNETVGNIEHIMQLAKSLSQHVIGMNPKVLKPTVNIDKEDTFLTQDYLMNDKLSVEDVLKQANVECVDFVRYGVNE